MTAIIIDENVRANIKAVVERAFANVISLDSLKARIEAGERTDDPSTRNPYVEATQDDMAVFIPAGIKTVFTVEEHPAGVCRHLSVSINRPGYTAPPIALQMLMEEFGFTSKIEDCIVYPETYAPGRIAVNVLEMV